MLISCSMNVKLLRVQTVIPLVSFLMYCIQYRMYSYLTPRWSSDTPSGYI
jgi:hypothetical protein